MKILAIRFARLGDVILLQPALAAIKASHPEARITLMTGHRCAPIAELSPAVDEVLSVDRVAMRDGPVRHALRDVKQLVSEVRHGNFDVVIDFHSFRETNLLTWLSGSPERIGLKRYNAPFLEFCFNRPPVQEDKLVHVNEMFLRVAEALEGVKRISTPPATLRIPDSLRSRLANVLPSGRRIALYVDAPVADRRWPAERFAAVADYIVERLDATPIILASPDNPGLAGEVLNASRNQGQLRSFDSLSLPELAAVIDSCDFLLSNDTGPMHLGPALGVRTLGLFSVGLTEHFSPMGKHDRFLKGQPIEEISEERVTQEIAQMWTIAADRDPRR